MRQHWGVENCRLEAPWEGFEGRWKVSEKTRLVFLCLKHIMFILGNSEKSGGKTKANFQTFLLADAPV